MGIPGLARHLQPYAVRYTLEDLTAYTAIVDGPSLAYYAHRLALSNSASQSRIPSYADINAEAIRWLNDLEDTDHKVATILFDGLLPLAKRTERVKRIEQNNKRVLQLRLSYPTTACPIPTFLGSVSYSFLAPSLKEALSASRFASITRVVPGEADDWCALYTSDNTRAIIFTSDTDLLLYDYPPETLVVFFNDLDISEGLKAYSPSLVCQRLQLNSLVPLAYAITQGPSDDLKKLAQDARSMDLETVEYLEFSNRYIAQDPAPIYMPKITNLSIDLQDLDARVSEFVHQALDNSPAPAVYLPLLVEDANQASAWNLGQEVRLLAYTILIMDRSASVQEYKRKAQAVVAQDLTLYSYADTDAAVEGIARDIDSWVTWAKSNPILSSQLMWLLFATRIVLVSLKTSPKISQLLRVLNGEFDNTWEFIHLVARIQACLYSLRMYKQIAAVWLSIHQNSNNPLFSTMHSLQRNLADMPSITDAFIVPGQLRRVMADHDVLRSLIEQVYELVGVDVPNEQVSNKKKKKQSREAKRKEQKAQRQEELLKQASPHSSNLFSVLGNDG